MKIASRERWCLFSVLYVIILLFVPWEELRGEPFPDLENYETRIFLLQNFGPEYFRYENSLLGWFRFEYLWFRILAFLSESGFRSDQIFMIITAFSAFVAHRFLSRHAGGFVALLIFLNPVSIDLYLSQIRSAFAFSLFLLALSMPRSVAGLSGRAVVFLSIPFIHSAMIFPLMISLHSIVISRIREHFDGPRFNLVASAILGILLAFLFVLQADSFLESIHDRRAVLDFGTRSLAFLAFWLGCTATIVLSNEECSSADWKRHYAVFCGAFAVSAELFGLPMFRMIALSIPVIIPSYLANAFIGTGLALFLYLVHSLLLFIFWIG